MAESKTVTLADMSPEQREVAFEKWMNGVEGKKVSNTAKRFAASELKKAHEPEYKKYVEAETKRLQTA